MPAAQLLGRAVHPVRADAPRRQLVERRRAGEAERYQHGTLAVRGRGPIADPAPGETAAAAPGRGLSVDGDGVVMTALRRRGEWLELRLVAEGATATEAVVRGPFDAARDADLLGRPLGALATDGGALRVALGPWEIRTVQLRFVVNVAGLR